MIAVIFEVWPTREQRGRYFDLAARLRSDLSQVEGFVSIERFESLTEPGKVLSLSFWRDEEAVARWRTASAHRAAQREGIETVFDDYRLRVAAVVRDYGLTDRDQAPADAWYPGDRSQHRTFRGPLAGRVPPP